MPLYFGAGKINTTRKIINRTKYETNPICMCPTQDKQSIINSSNNNDRQTQNERIATLVDTSLGGRTRFGNFVDDIQLTNFLNSQNKDSLQRVVKPIRNKF